jgi:hypothetical protein
VPPQTPQPEPPAEDWSKRFAGLQQAIQKRLQATGWGNLDAIPSKADYDRLAVEAGKATDLQGQFEQLSLAAQNYATEKATLVQQIAALESGQQKLNLILQNAPALVSFAEYIPTKATAEEQLAEITNFQTRLGSMAPAPTTMRPPSVPSSAPPLAGNAASSSELFAQMNAAMAAKNWSEYERLSDLWHSQPKSNDT